MEEVVSGGQPLSTVSAIAHTPQRIAKRDCEGTCPLQSPMNFLTWPHYPRQGGCITQPWVYAVQRLGSIGVFIYLLLLTATGYASVL